MDRQSKEALVAELREDLMQVPSVVIARSVGVDANTMNDLRAKLRASGSKYRVVKNTLVKRAIEGTELEVLADQFSGPTAIAYNLEDAVAPAKVLVDAAEKIEKLELQAGWLNGAVLDAEGIEQLSKMPGKDELRAKLLMCLNGVATNMVRVLSAAPRDFLGVLNARKAELG